jgi:hypothetical protein
MELASLEICGERKAEKEDQARMREEKGGERAGCRATGNGEEEQRKNGWNQVLQMIPHLLFHFRSLYIQPGCSALQTGWHRLVCLAGPLTKGT